MYGFKKKNQSSLLFILFLEEFLTPSQSPVNEPDIPVAVEIAVPQQLSTESMDESFYEK